MKDTESFCNPYRMKTVLKRAQFEGNLKHFSVNPLKTEQYIVVESLPPFQSITKLFHF